MTVSGCARYIGEHFGFTVRPRDISLAFYDRALPDDAGPVVSGRREIAESAVPLIVEALRRRGKLMRAAA
jgi:hypothetical protein